MAYANEEPPFYQTPAMGSAVHAKSVSHHPGRKKIIGMIALETLGCYSPRVNKKRQSAVVAGLAGLPDRGGIFRLEPFSGAFRRIPVLRPRRFLV